MDTQACTVALRAKVGDSSALNARLKFDCGADGVPDTGFLVAMKPQRVV